MRLRFRCLIVCCLASGAASAQERAPAPERVLYTAMRPANWDIYLFEKGAAEPRALAAHPALDYNPVFSPDGRWVVFCSERHGSPDLFALDLQREPEKLYRLTADAALEDAPAFAPDGRSLAFVSTKSGNADIFAMPFRPADPAAFKEAVNLTRAPGGDFNPAFAPDGRTIAFASNRDRTRASEIYRMNADGSGQQRLTDARGWDGSPAWSPDGAVILFTSEREGGSKLWRMDRDGNNQRPISDSPALSPAAGRDGRIWFSQRRGDGARIVSIAADGSGERLESDAAQEYWAPDTDRRSGSMVCHGSAPDSDPNPIGRFKRPFAVAGGRQRIELPDRALELHPLRGNFPSLGPDGVQVVSALGFSKLMISALDGSGLRELFETESGSAWGSIWSRNGRWIAFSVGPTFAGARAAADIWRIRPDGGGAVNLTSNATGNDAWPDFSADGERIVFRSGRDGNHEIYWMRSDGSGQRRLTEDPATDTMPAFAPDGRQVAFSSNRDGNFEIYTLEIDAEGNPGKLTRVTREPGLDMHPRYSPDGAWLVFASERGGINDEEPLIPIYNPQPYGEIWALRLSDGLTLRLTHNKWEDGTPGWGASHSRSGIGSQ